MTLAQKKLSDPPALTANDNRDVHARVNLPAALPSPRTPSPPAYVLSWTPNVPWRAIPLPPASAFFGQSRSLLSSAQAPHPFGRSRPSSPADSFSDRCFDKSPAGALAGAASRTVVSPLERLKIILQVQGASAEYKGVYSGLKKMWQEEGFRGASFSFLFPRRHCPRRPDSSRPHSSGYMRGNGINVLRIAPYSAVQVSRKCFLHRWLQLFVRQSGKRLLF